MITITQNPSILIVDQDGELSGWPYGALIASFRNGQVFLTDKYGRSTVYVGTPADFGYSSGLEAVETLNGSVLSSRTVPNDLYGDVGNQENPNIVKNRKFGVLYSLSAGSTPTDINAYIGVGTLAYPSTNGTLTIRSLDGNDILGGSGMERVTIEYLEDDGSGNWMQKFVTVEMAGTSSAPVGTGLRVNRVIAAETGATNVGALLVEHNGSGVLAYVRPGAGVTQQTNYCVPSDFRYALLKNSILGIMRQIGAGGQGIKRGEIYFFARQHGSVFVEAGNFPVTTEGGAFEIFSVVGERALPKTDIVFRATADDSNARFSAAYEIHLFK